MTNKLCKETNKVLGGLINKYRALRGLSYRQLSKATNISCTLLSDTENGNKIPRFETIIKIAEALDIPLNEIFSENIIPIGTQKSSNTLDNILYSKGLSKADVNFINEYIKFKTHTL